MIRVIIESKCYRAQAYTRYQEYNEYMNKEMKKKGVFK